MAAPSSKHVTANRWWKTLIAVDVPSTPPVYRPGRAVSLPQLLDAELLPSCDPRLSSVLPPASIYARFTVTDLLGELNEVDTTVPNEPDSNVKQKSKHKRRTKDAAESGKKRAKKTRQTKEVVAAPPAPLVVKAEVVENVGEPGKRRGVPQQKAAASQAALPLSAIPMPPKKVQKSPTVAAGKPAVVQKSDLIAAAAKPPSKRHAAAESGVKVSKRPKTMLSPPSNLEASMEELDYSETEAVENSGGQMENFLEDEMEEVLTMARKVLSYVDDGTFPVFTCIVRRQQALYRRMKVLSTFVDLDIVTDDPMLMLTLCELDDISSVERQDFLSDLNSVFLGRRPRFVVLARCESAMPSQRLGSLSMATYCDGHFIQSRTVTRVHMAALQRWTAQEPLEAVVRAAIAGLAPPARFVFAPMLFPAVLHFVPDSLSDWLSEKLWELLDADGLGHGVRRTSAAASTTDTRASAHCDKIAKEVRRTLGSYMNFLCENAEKYFAYEEVFRELGDMEVVRCQEETPAEPPENNFFPDDIDEMDIIAAQGFDAEAELYGAPASPSGKKPKKHLHDRRQKTSHESDHRTKKMPKRPKHVDSSGDGIDLAEVAPTEATAAAAPIAALSEGERRAMRVKEVEEEIKKIEMAQQTIAASKAPLEGEDRPMAGGDSRRILVPGTDMLNAGIPTSQMVITVGKTLAAEAANLVPVTARSAADVTMTTVMAVQGTSIAEKPPLMPLFSAAGPIASSQTTVSSSVSAGPLPPSTVAPLPSATRSTITAEIVKTSSVSTDVLTTSQSTVTAVSSLPFVTQSVTFSAASLSQAATTSTVKPPPLPGQALLRPLAVPSGKTVVRPAVPAAPATARPSLRITFQVFPDAGNAAAAANSGATKPPMAALPASSSALAANQSAISIGDHATSGVVAVPIAAKPAGGLFRPLASTSLQHLTQPVPPRPAVTSGPQPPVGVAVKSDQVPTRPPLLLSDIMSVRQVETSNQLPGQPPLPPSDHPERKSPEPSQAVVLPASQATPPQGKDATTPSPTSTTNASVVASQSTAITASPVTSLAAASRAQGLAGLRPPPPAGGQAMLRAMLQVSGSRIPASSPPGGTIGLRPPMLLASPSRTTVRVVGFRPIVTSAASTPGNASMRAPGLAPRPVIPNAIANLRSPPLSSGLGLATTTPPRSAAPQKLPAESVLPLPAERVDSSTPPTKPAENLLKKFDAQISAADVEKSDSETSDLSLDAGDDLMLELDEDEIAVDEDEGGNSAENKPQSSSQEAKVSSDSGKKCSPSESDVIVLTDDEGSTAVSSGSEQQVVEGSAMRRGVSPMMSVSCIPAVAEVTLTSGPAATLAATCVSDPLMALALAASREKPLLIPTVVPSFASVPTDAVLGSVATVSSATVVPSIAPVTTVIGVPSIASTSLLVSVVPSSVLVPIATSLPSTTSQSVVAVLSSASPLMHQRTASPLISLTPLSSTAQTASNASSLAFPVFTDSTVPSQMSTTSTTMLLTDSCTPLIAPKLSAPASSTPKPSIPLELVHEPASPTESAHERPAPADSAFEILAHGQLSPFDSSSESLPSIDDLPESPAAPIPPAPEPPAPEPSAPPLPDLAPEPPAPSDTSPEPPALTDSEWLEMKHRELTQELESITRNLPAAAEPVKAAADPVKSSSGIAYEKHDDISSSESDLGDEVEREPENSLTPSLSGKSRSPSRSRSHSQSRSRSWSHHGSRSRSRSYSSRSRSRSYSSSSDDYDDRHRHRRHHHRHSPRHGRRHRRDSRRSVSRKRRSETPVTSSKKRKLDDKQKKAVPQSKNKTTSKQQVPKKPPAIEKQKGQKAPKVGAAAKTKTQVTKAPAKKTAGKIEKKKPKEADKTAAPPVENNETDLKQRESELEDGEIIESSLDQGKPIEDEIEKPKIRSIEERLKVYDDAYLTWVCDAYGRWPASNFEQRFDPTRAPRWHKNPFKRTWPVLQDAIRVQGDAPSTVPGFPDVTAFSLQSVMRDNAFLWALNLSLFDKMESENYEVAAENAVSENAATSENSADAADVEPSKNRAVLPPAPKAPSNPLMQAFRQAVEAKRKSAMNFSKSKLQTESPSSQISTKTMKFGKMSIVFGSGVKTGGSLSEIFVDGLEEDKSQFAGLIKSLVAEINQATAHPWLANATTAARHLKAVSEPAVGLYEAAETQLAVELNDEETESETTDDASVVTEFDSVKEAVVDASDKPAENEPTLKESATALAVVANVASETIPVVVPEPPVTPTPLTVSASTPTTSVAVKPTPSTPSTTGSVTVAPKPTVIRMVAPGFRMATGAAARASLASKQPAALPRAGATAAESPRLSATVRPSAGQSAATRPAGPGTTTPSPARPQAPNAAVRPAVRPAVVTATSGAAMATIPASVSSSANSVASKQPTTTTAASETPLRQPYWASLINAEVQGSNTPSSGAAASTGISASITQASQGLPYLAPPPIPTLCLQTSASTPFPIRSASVSSSYGLATASVGDVPAMAPPPIPQLLSSTTVASSVFALQPPPMPSFALLDVNFSASSQSSQTYSYAQSTATSAVTPQSNASLAPLPIPSPSMFTVPPPGYIDSSHPPPAGISSVPPPWFPGTPDANGIHLMVGKPPTTAGIESYRTSSTTSKAALSLLTGAGGSTDEPPAAGGPFWATGLRQGGVPSTVAAPSGYMTNMPLHGQFSGGTPGQQPPHGMQPAPAKKPVMSLLDLDVRPPGARGPGPAQVRPGGGPSTPASNMAGDHMMGMTPGQPARFGTGASPASGFGGQSFGQAGQQGVRPFGQNQGQGTPSGQSAVRTVGPNQGQVTPVGQQGLRPFGQNHGQVQLTGQVARPLMPNQGQTTPAGQQSTRPVGQNVGQVTPPVRPLGQTTPSGQAVRPSANSASTVVTHRPLGQTPGQGTPQRQMATRPILPTVSPALRSPVTTPIQTTPRPGAPAAGNQNTPLNAATGPGQPKPGTPAVATPSGQSLTQSTPVRDQTLASTTAAAAASQPSMPAPTAAPTTSTVSTPASTATTPATTATTPSTMASTVPTPARPSGPVAAGTVSQSVPQLIHPSFRARLNLTDGARQQGPIIAPFIGFARKSRPALPSAPAPAQSSPAPASGAPAPNQSSPAAPVARSNCRFYVLRNDNILVTRETERYMLSTGARLFDPYNAAALACIPQLECRVMIHVDDLIHGVHRIPNLLRLKRHLAVIFLAYRSLREIQTRTASIIFPRAGVVVMDTATLLACQSDVLDSICQFMLKQRTERNVSWILKLSADTDKQLEKLRDASDEDAETAVRLIELSQVVNTYRSQGIISELSSDDPATGPPRSPRSTLDYLTVCVSLQSKLLHQYRHFLYITDLPRAHPDARQFLDGGIDVMSVTEFTRGFMAKVVTHQSLKNKALAVRISPKPYVDAKLSSGVDAVNNL